jgi:hypothetical protein
MAPRTRSERPDAASDWLVFDAFAIEEDLTYSDCCRLGSLGLLPRVEVVNDTPWVHRPSLPWWRELLKIHGFKTFGETIRSKAQEAADAS